jgi:AcrR family transcriptional regulator
MAKDTKQRLLASALDLFSSQWYETASVADICRNAGVSNGVFYRYFKNKQEIFSVLLDHFLDEFSAEMHSVSGSSLSERLESFIRLIIEVGERLRPWVTVFREGQYRFPQYEKRLRRLYLEALERVYERKVTESEYLYIVSGLRFISTRSLYDKLEFSPNAARRIILDGLFEGTLREGLFVKMPEIPYFYREDALPESRRKLLETGIKLFGRRGYHPVSIYEIVHDAGFAVGTFYTHFTGKQAFLEEIVDLIGRTARHSITAHLSPELNRLEREIQGYWLFLQLFLQHPEFYQIVREAEFVVKDSVSRYYCKFQEGYRRHMLEAKLPLKDDREVNTCVSFLMGIAHYLGIEVIFSREIVRIEDRLQEIAGFLVDGIPR